MYKPYKVHYRLPSTLHPSGPALCGCANVNPVTTECVTRASVMDGPYACRTCRRLILKITANSDRPIFADD